MVLGTSKYFVNKPVGKVIEGQYDKFLMYYTFLQNRHLVLIMQVHVENKDNVHYLLCIYASFMDIKIH